MKKHFSILALSVIAALSFTSCSSDDSGDSTGTTTGNYFPMAVNNVWNYTDGSTATNAKLIGTTPFGGTAYYEVEDTSSDLNIQNWVAKKGASYYQKTAASTIVQSGTTITMEGYEYKLLRDDLETGETWSGKVNPKVTYSGSMGSGTLPSRIDYEGKITARNTSATFEGTTYPNVIKMAMIVTLVINSQTTVIDNEYWFAKDVGLIYESITSSTDNITKTRHITSYTLN